MGPGTPFGPGIRTLLTYLHHSRHVGFERLSRLAAEMTGLTISQGVIPNMFPRLVASIATAIDAIRETLRSAGNGMARSEWMLAAPQPNRPPARWRRDLRPPVDLFLVAGTS